MIARNIALLNIFINKRLKLYILARLKPALIERKGSRTVSFGTNSKYLYRSLIASWEFSFSI